MSPDQQAEVLARIRRSLEGRSEPVKVLLVEDNDIDAEMSIHNLERAGVKVYWARNSQEIGEHIGAHSPRIAFLDLNLSASGMDSLQVLKFIQSTQPDCTVIVLTGAYRSDSIECKEALEAGAVLAMLKPLTSEQIEVIFGSPK